MIFTRLLNLSISRRVRKGFVFLRISCRAIAFRIAKPFRLEKKILIFPGDTRHPDGSRGDQAMLQVVIEVLRNRYPSASIQMVCESKDAEAAIARFGAIPFMRKRFHGFDQILDLEVASFDYVVILGADIMDGHYDSKQSVDLWNRAENAQRAGAQVVITGCSFNNSPSAEVCKLLDSLKSDFSLNVRDPKSFRRLMEFAPNKVRLVADVAFLLNDEINCSSNVLTALEWIKKQRAEGRLLLGINIHSLLFRSMVKENIEILTQSIANVLIALCKTHKIAVMLVPHDFRPTLNDAEDLEELRARLQPAMRGSVCLVRGEPSARELKSLVGKMDVTLTGRMHLAIASIGREVPAAVITYQGKFEGMLEQFELPEWLMITPENAQNEMALSELIIRLLESRTELKDIIINKYQIVTHLAEKNFELFR